MRVWGGVLKGRLCVLRGMWLEERMLYGLVGVASGVEELHAKGRLLLFCGWETASWLVRSLLFYVLLFCDSVGLASRDKRGKLLFGGKTTLRLVRSLFLRFFVSWLVGMASRRLF